MNIEYIWWPMPLFLDFYFTYRYRYNMEVERRRLIHTIYFDWGLLVVLLAICGLKAWMQWSCIDVIVFGFKSVEELYPSPPLGADSEETSQLPKEKNLHGQFQYFQITQPGSSTVKPGSSTIIHEYRTFNIFPKT
jgi:hypothetical protein